MKNTQQIKEYNYIPDKEFSKMERAEKMAMPELFLQLGEGIEISLWVLIPTTKKMDGWSVGAFFALTESGWCRLGDYDCWRVVTDIQNPITIKYGLVRGDFQYGGVCFFGYGDEGKNNKIVAEYGGELSITKRT